MFVDARQIQDMRALLAAEAADADARAPGFTVKLKGLMGAQSSLRPPKSPAPQADPSIAAPSLSAEPADWTALYDPPPALLDNDLAIPDPWTTASYDPPPDLVPTQVLLGPIAPHRAAFGQRREPVLELREPAPAEPRRLTLMGVDGAAVGEIILHASDMVPAAPEIRRFEPLHSEVPFFPDDLADESHPAPLKSRPHRPSGAKPTPAVSSVAEFAASFLLANLAARLAVEEAALNQRLASTTPTG